MFGASFRCSAKLPSCARLDGRDARLHTFRAHTLWELDYILSFSPLVLAIVRLWSGAVTCLD
jgi:hypothetical protein